MIRQALPDDLDAIAALYEAIHDTEEAGQATIGWVRGIYPTRETAQRSIAAGSMYLDTEAGKLISAGKIDREQVPEYANAPWTVNAPPEKILVLHTLVVNPKEMGHGYASRFVGFYEDLARSRCCSSLRMDTNERNIAARSLYRKLGYTEVGIVRCCFNGIPGVRLVCLEKLL